MPPALCWLSMAITATMYWMLATVLSALQTMILQNRFWYFAILQMGKLRLREGVACPRPLLGGGECGPVQPNRGSCGLSLSPQGWSRAELDYPSVPSHLRHVIAVWLWASDSVSLSLSPHLQKEDAKIFPCGIIVGLGEFAAQETPGALPCKKISWCLKKKCKLYQRIAL